MTALPRQIHPAGFPAIREESERLEKRATAIGGSAWDEYDKDVQMQNRFLDCFRRTFSVRRSIQFADIEYSRYQKWKKVSIHFVESFNEIIDMWHEDIFTSAAQKARGYLVKDPETESGYGEDAEGSPIYHGADTGIQKAFLKAMYPDQFAERTKNEVSGPEGAPLQITRTIIDPKAKE